MTYGTEIFFQTLDDQDVVIKRLEGLWGIKFQPVEGFDGLLLRDHSLGLKITLSLEHGMEDESHISFSAYPYAILLRPTWKQVSGEGKFLDSIAIFMATQLFETLQWPSMAVADVQAVLAKFG